MNDRTVITKGSVTNKKIPRYAYAGGAIIIAALVLLFSGNQFVGHWMTPIVWTGYILLVDGVLYRLKGRSLFTTDRLELVLIAIISIGGWWLCEFYNAPRFWESDLELWWHYHNLEPNLMLRRAGYDWAFATIFPLLFLTAEVFRLTFFERFTNAKRVKISRTGSLALIAIGGAGMIIPLIFPSAWYAPLIWFAFIFLLDPLNAIRGYPSITCDLAQGDWRRLWSLLASGLFCGFLWEFFNYWAISKWTYTVPYLGNIKIFEMPVLGFLGFPPFAIECWAIYIFVRSLLQPGVREATPTDIFLSLA